VLIGGVLEWGAEEAFWGQVVGSESGMVTTALWGASWLVLSSARGNQVGRLCGTNVNALDSHENWCCSRRRSRIQNNSEK
jgi:hypothetical protein